MGTIGQKKVECNYSFDKNVEEAIMYGSKEHCMLREGLLT